MALNIGPKEMQESVRIGFKRLRNFRSARVMFMKNYVGPYYDRDHGDVGTEPLNLIFNAIRVLIPHIVMNNPRNKVSSEYVEYKEYAELLGLALNFNSRQLDVERAYRKAIVDSVFAVGILKTGLADSGTAITFDETGPVDPGIIYTEHVDFDNFAFDPTVRSDIREAGWIGDQIIMPRVHLLDSGLYNNAMIEQLPAFHKRDRASNLSSKEVSDSEMSEYADEVAVMELWVPGAKALVTIPAPGPEGHGPKFNEYLRVADYNGPDSGPYSLLSLTPDAPGNPLPPAPVGIWADLHVMANRMVKKTLDQADRQKDLVLYRRSAADDAQEALDAGDGEAVAVDDPQGIASVSFGGQNQANPAMIEQLQMWFNMMAGNPQGVGGLDLRAASATEANILQSNADITLEDMRYLVYKFAGEESKKRAFYLHTDPLIELPLARREVVMTDNGPQVQDVQVFLTPEARRGDFLDYTVTIEPESMGRVDSRVRLQRSLDFAVKIIPAAASIAQVLTPLGIPFNLQVYIENMAKEAGIDWMDEVWYDPLFQQRLAMHMQMGPQMGPSKGQLGGAVQQNGQPGQVMRTRNPQQQTRRDQQMGAAQGQADLPVRES